MADDLAEELASAKRALTFYRIALVVVFGMLAWLTFQVGKMFQVSDAGAYAEVWTVDLQERQAKADEAVANGAVDVIDPLFESPDGSSSVHLHVMGHGQTTPLHLHPKADELTIVAGGTAVVRHVWGGDGHPGESEATFERHGLVYSPPACGHEFENPHRDRTLAALVFAAPQFGGNLYVDADDSRLASGAAPFVFVPEAGAARSISERTLERLPALDGRVLHVRTPTTFEIPPNLHSPIFVYVYEGTGAVRGKALREGTLVHLENGDGMTITADPGAPLGLLVVDVYRAMRDRRDEP